MHLVADRFVVGEKGAARDLATGAEVDFRTLSGGTVEEERRWTMECDEASRWHHPATPRLIDYGVAGGSIRFEARQLLRMRGAERRWGAAPGMERIARSVVGSIGEALDHQSAMRPRCLVVTGPSGSGRHTIIEDVARLARQRGFVPIAARLFAHFSDPLRGRSLLVVAEQSDACGWTSWLLAALHGARAHVLLLVGDEAIASRTSLTISPVSNEALVRAVRPSAAGKAPAAIVRLAAEARGWPGCFARLLWRLPPAAVRGSSAEQPASWSATAASVRGLRAAEQPGIYGEHPQSATAVSVRTHSYGRDDIDRWCQKIEAAKRLIARGRHAHGERLLRQSTAALSRRNAWTHAAQGSLELASLLLRRGRSQAADRILRESAGWFRRAGDESHLTDVLLLAATASLDLARLDQAEASAGAAATAARTRGDDRRWARASLVLARTLTWRARYSEADAILRSISSSSHAVETIAARTLEAAVAIGLGDIGRAVSRAIEALAAARKEADANLIGRAAKSAALAYLAAGDLPAVEGAVMSSVAAAREERNPLLAAKSRLILAEGLRRAGRPAAAHNVLSRIGRIPKDHLPPILRARSVLLQDLLSATTDLDAIVQRHVAATGLGGLALYGPVPLSANRTMSDPTIATIIDILNLCQASDDERTVMEEVCRRMRARLHATATAIVADEDGRLATLSADGGRMELTSAGRAVESDLMLQPQRSADGIEAAIPIRSGGRAIGAFCARWSGGTPYDLGFAPALMTAVAAAIAPLVATLVARSRRLGAPPMTAILGSSAVMADVRRGIERAAAAPFAVLIHGESGCGKELVARALHASGPRRQRALCTLNCAALPDELIEAELFGHARGAFTGAVGERAGVFEEAHGGTLFLDEIGELSLRAQAKLLRVIQEGELRRVGEAQSRRIDVRIVSASNRLLHEEVAAGRFRLDLLYRLDVVSILVPPLRDRREDIPVLTEYFWREATGRVGSRATLSPAAVAALCAYSWPGNVRQLQNALAALAVRSAKRGIVTAEALGPQFCGGCLSAASRLEEARRTFDQQFVRAALLRVGGHRARAAAELGVSRQGLTKLMSRLGIT
jgi:DNA-binding NtrC family response regulator/tetratricopeptide (TPR) repeat protein